MSLLTWPDHCFGLVVLQSDASSAAVWTGVRGVLYVKVTDTGDQNVFIALITLFFLFSFK